MSQESQGKLDVLEKVETAPRNEFTENPMVVYADGKIEKSKPKDKRAIKAKIRSLKNEIEHIQLANSKLEDAKLRGIPKEAIADDVSFAGLSIEERKGKIVEFKQILNDSKGKPWLKRVAIVIPFLLGGLLATKEASGQKSMEKEKATTAAQYEEQASWIKKIIGSSEYKKRLKKEFDGDVKKASMVQKQRLANLDKDYVLEPVDSIEKRTMVGVVGQYELKDGLVHLVDTMNDTDSTEAIHEFNHQATNADSGLSEKAKDLYAKAFNPENIMRELSDTAEQKFWVNYLKKPSELDSRKRQLEKQMEVLGVKKYGEVFTEEHYKKIKQLYDQGVLNIGAQEFMLAIKPEYFIEIMNTIAYNDIVSKESEAVA